MDTLLDGLFDLLCNSKIRLEKLEQQHGIPMTKAEYDFSVNMGGDRSYLCDKIDVSFHRQQNEKLRKLNKKNQERTIKLQNRKF